MSTCPSSPSNPGSYMCAKAAKTTVTQGTCLILLCRLWHWEKHLGHDSICPAITYSLCLLSLWHCHMSYYFLANSYLYSKLLFMYHVLSHCRPTISASMLFSILFVFYLYRWLRNGRISCFTLWLTAFFSNLWRGVAKTTAGGKFGLKGGL